MGKLKLVMIGVVIAILAFTGVAGANTYVYTDENAFKAALITPYYLEDFSTYFDAGDIGTSQGFSGNGFSYTMSANNLYGGESSYDSTTLPSMSTTLPNVTLSIGTFSSNVKAIGGLFYLTDFDGSLYDGIGFTVSINGVNYNFAASATPTFLGIIDTAGISTLSFPNSTNYFSTISNLYVGNSAVPVPPSVLLLGSGLLGLIGIRRFRS
jgi:hypothetical protein